MKVRDVGENINPDIAGPADNENSGGSHIVF